MERSIAVSLILFAVSLILGPPAMVHAVEEISTLSQLQAIGKSSTALAGSYILTNNIDASDTTSWNGAEGFVPIGTSINPFIGTFNGNGYVINNLTIKRSLVSKVGLFGSARNATITNVGVEGVDITGNMYVGGLVGQSQDSKISNCYSTGAVAGNGNVGGLAGILVGGDIENAFSTAAAKAPNHVGGLVGQNNAGTVLDCYSTGAVGTSSSLLTGGLVGGVYNKGTVTASYWDKETSGRSTSVGGDGKTTAQMMSKATFSGWDFNSTWCIKEGTGYPCLHVFPDTCECSPRLTTPNPGGNPTGATIPAFTGWGILVLSGLLVVIAAVINSKKQRTL